MSQLGLGVMLNQLCGDRGSAKLDRIKEKIISNAVIDESGLTLTFEDGYKVKFWDDGQSCCESRYVKCDDDVKILEGGKLLGIKEKETEHKELNYGDVHEIGFIEICTDKGSIVMNTHVEYNGYYGGFFLKISEVS